MLAYIAATLLVLSPFYIFIIFILVKFYQLEKFLIQSREIKAILSTATQDCQIEKLLNEKLKSALNSRVENTIKQIVDWVK